jgi:hypothetical protein
MVLTINDDCFPKQHQVAGLCSGDVMCFQWGMNWILMYYLQVIPCSLVRTYHVFGEHIASIVRVKYKPLKEASSKQSAFLLEISPNLAVEWCCVPQYLGRMWAHCTRPRWCMGEWCIWNKTIGRGRLTYPVVHFPPHISRRLTRGWTPAYAVRKRLLAACVMISNSGYTPTLTIM